MYLADWDIDENVTVRMVEDLGYTALPDNTRRALLKRMAAMVCRYVSEHSTVEQLVSAYAAGGGAMFALLALAGDLGATAGPATAGGLAGSATSGGLLAGLARILPGDSGTGLRPALLVCALIPVLYALAVLAVGRTGRGRAERSQALRPRRG